MPVIRKEISDHQFIVERDSASAFPIIGKTNTLYIALDTNTTYRFNVEDLIYIEVSENWKEIKIINGGKA